MKHALVALSMILGEKMKISPGMFPQSLGVIGQKRHKLYILIESAPGLHFRELQRRTEMATGQLLYHLHWLERKSVIKTILDGQYLRFYTLETLGENERTVLEFARQDSVRHILILLLERECLNHEIIFKNLKLAPSTVSWHLKKLVNTNIVSKEIDGRKTFYRINDPDLVRNTLMKYKESFLDKVVDRFIEMWEE
jgi:predicted transcriptional regulator